MSVQGVYKRHTAELPMGEFQANLISVDEIESKVTGDAGDDLDPLAWRWLFRISQDPYSGVEISGISSRTYSQKSKSFTWARALNHPAPPADFDAALIEGKPCRLAIIVDEKPDGSSYNRILSVNAPVKSQTAISLEPAPVGAL